MSVSLIDQFWRYHGLHFAAGCVLGAFGGLLARNQRWQVRSLLMVLVVQLLAGVALGTVPLEAAALAIVLLALSADLRDGSSMVMPLAATSSIGVWLAVPDTEAPVLLMGFMCVFSVGSFVSGLQPPSRFLPILALCVAAGFGSAGLPAVVGGIGCLGVLPFLAKCPAEPSRRLGLLATHLGAVAVSSRIVMRFGWSKATLLQGLLSLLCLVAYLITTRDRPGRSAGHETVL